MEKLDEVVEKYEVSQLCMKDLHISQAKNNAAVGQGGGKKHQPQGRTQPIKNSKGKVTTSQPSSKQSKC